MDATIGIYLLVIFGILIACGFPIAIAIACSSICIMLSVMPMKVVAITAGQKLATGMDSFSLLAVPFFVLAGNIMNQGGIAKRFNRLLRCKRRYINRRLVPRRICARYFNGSWLHDCRLYLL